ncbi:MAG: TIR domain-containing protein [Sandaracinaceae bacterium]
MADVFISYSHRDRAAAQAVKDALIADGWSVWWDPELRAGHPFDTQIERAHREARVVVVLWSEAAVASDWVRAEAEEAARRRKLVSVRLDGATLPLRFRIVQTLDIGDFAGSLGGDPVRRRALLQEVAQALGRPEAQIELSIRDWAGAVLRAARAAALVGALVVLALGSHLLDAIDVDTRWQWLAMTARGWAGRAPVPEDLLYVRLTPDDVDRLGGPYGPAYRCHHAALLDALSSAGARVVAFDVYFPDADAPCGDAGAESATDRLASAIGEAIGRGTSVVIGERTPSGTSPQLRRALEGTGPAGARGKRTHLCMGLKAGALAYAPLMISGGGHERKLGLALATYALHRGGRVLWDAASGRLSLERPERDEVRPLPLTARRSVALARADCAFLATPAATEGTRAADPHRVGLAILDLGRRPPDGVREAAYADVLAAPSAAANRAVLVGVELPALGDQRHLRTLGRPVYGARLHASILWSLLDGEIVEEASTPLQIGLIVIASFVAALLRVRLRYHRRVRLWSLLFVLGLTVTFVLVSATLLDLLFEGFYPLLGAASAYVAAAR